MTDDEMGKAKWLECDKLASRLLSWEHLPASARESWVLLAKRDLSTNKSEVGNET